MPDFTVYKQQNEKNSLEIIEEKPFPTSEKKKMEIKYYIFKNVNLL